jgi:hypothetical protein
MPPHHQKRRPGRPRIWADEAERKRAYRRRRADELADPIRLREVAKAATAAQSRAQQEVLAAGRMADRLERRIATLQRELGVARERARRARVRAERSTAERDEARRLLTRKLQHARQAVSALGVRADPNALLAIIAELYPELDRLRQQNKALRRALGWPPAPSELVRTRSNPTP